MASALLSFMAACNNDALEEATSQNVEQAGEEIVGAKLLSKGATLQVNLEGNVESRLSGTGFEDGDELGLGWFNIKDNIFDVQGSTFEGCMHNDAKLYANHLFRKNTVWSSFANIYEGAHFAYYPYSHMGQVAIKSFELANVQKSDKDNEYLEEGFQASPKLILTDKDVESKDLVLPINLYNMTNTLKFNVDNAGSPFGTNPVLSKETIQDVTVTVNRTDNMNTFVTKVTMNPHYLPETQYLANGELDTENNKKNMRDAEALFYSADNHAFMASTANNVVKTTTKHAPNFGTNSTVYMNLFPAEAVAETAFATEYPVRIDLHTRFGHFTWASVKNAKADAGKVYQFLQGKIQNKGINTLTNNFNIDLKLADASWFAPNYHIKNAQDWDDAVAFANALKEEFKNNANFAKAKFYLDGDVVFNNRPMFQTENNVEISVVSPTDAGKIVIKGDVEMAVNLKFPAEPNNNWANIEVTEGATFTVGTSVNTSISNKGTIKVLKGNKVSTVTNFNRIEVEYGAFVATDGTNKGIVAYEVTAETKPYMIANLIKEQQVGADTQVRFAQVNTLVVTAAKALDLSEKDGKVENDPYYDQIQQTEMPNLTSINVELIGGKIYNSAAEINGIATKTVQNINVLNGGVMKDVTAIEVVVEKGEFLVDASFIGHSLNKNELNISTFVNKAKTTFDVNATVRNLTNVKGAHLTVNDNYMIHWTSKYEQNGTTTGKIEVKK
ncbi:hypothetical protein EVA_18610 [gut metagenome]|uniref:Uncharacterized protein n=1 Tax=gut metagenome TaxID=749906 RepID=J9C0D7_9ZZZZ